jgi:hypothetical protein
VTASPSILGTAASLCASFAVICVVAACGDAVPQALEPADSIEVDRMNKGKPMEPTEPTDPRNMPTQVPVSAEQTQYVGTLIESVANVVSGKVELPHIERQIFGPGVFHYPKDSRQPPEAVRYYAAENFKIKFVTLSLSRQDRQSPWVSASLSIQPQNAPRGAYVFNLPPTVFAAMKLVKSFAEQRPANGSAPAHLVHVFEFLKADASTTVRLIFECRQELCDLKAAFPSSFHLLKISRVAT